MIRASEIAGFWRYLNGYANGTFRDEDSITIITDICDDLQFYSGKRKRLRLLIDPYNLFSAWTGAESDKLFVETFH